MNDIPIDGAQVTGFTQADQGTVTELADGRLQFTADNNASGTTSFDYTIAKNQVRITGSDEGDELGAILGSAVGELDGNELGWPLGDKEGEELGTLLGSDDGILSPST